MHDIIIIGAGVAGSYLASLLNDFDVLLLEKEKRISVKDSGIVSTKFSEFINDPKLIKEKINRMDLFSPNKTISPQLPAYLLERKKLSHLLKKLSRPKYETAKKVIIEKDRAVVITNKGHHEAKLVIGADGANSIVRKSLGIKDPELFLGMLVKTRKKLDNENISVYFNKYFSPEFFAWISRKEYGLITNIRPKEYLKYFQSSLSLPNGKLYASLIPIGYTKSVANRALLIGDSCGQVKPITGGGIVFSLTAARHAENTIRKAFEKQRFNENLLSSYENAWKRDFGYEIRKQLRFRKVYRKLTNNEIDKLFQDFGPVLGRSDFNYDHLSGIMWKLPKLKLMRFAISKCRNMI